MLVAYTKPRVYLTGVEYEEPIEHIVTTFDGRMLYSERRWLGRRDSSGIDITQNFSMEKGPANTRLLRLYAEQTTPLEAPRMVEELLLSGPEMQVWQDLHVSSGSCDWNLGLRPNTYTCAFCGASMDTSATGKLSDQKAYFLAELVHTCQECGWWRTENTMTLREAWHAERLIRSKDFNCVAYGSVREYDLSAADIPLSELRQWLQKHPSDVVHTNSAAFEKLLAACFRDVYKDVEVIHVGKSGDEGIDILIVRGNAVEAVIQVKRRMKLESAEGVKAVRELNGVLFRRGIAKGIFVTTAKGFTKAAIREAVSTPESFARYKVDLLAFDDVLNLLNCKSSNASAHDTKVADYLAAISLRNEVLRLHQEITKTST